jgi:hypothetical protein
MSFKLRYTTEEMHEHLRDRASYWQGQKEYWEREFKSATRENAEFMRKEEEKQRKETEAERDRRYLYGYHRNVMMICAHLKRIEDTARGVRDATESLKRIQLIQLHIPDVQYHDLEFEDLPKLEIKA